VLGARSAVWIFNLNSAFRIARRSTSGSGTNGIVQNIKRGMGSIRLSETERKFHIWIFEYKDDFTPIGATFLRGYLEDLEEIDDIRLPHLHRDWHWRIQIDWKKRGND
jgi:hypothetical protein